MSEEREDNHKLNAEDSGKTEAAAAEEERQEEQYSFLQETFKDEKLTGKKMWNSIWKTAGKGLLFGLTACLAFCALRPWAESRFGEAGSKTVTIPKDSENVDPDSEPEGEEQSEQTVEYPELTVENYLEMNRALYQIVVEASRCVAEVGAVRDEANWENTEFDAVNSVSGVIIWENSSEVLIVAPARITQDAQSLSVTFSDMSTYPATLKKQDLNLGLAVFSVERQALSDNTLNQIKAAELGNSNIVVRGDPVITLGKQFGYAGGVGYGIISSVRNKISVADGEYRILTTDITAADGGSSVLFNTEGEVIGLADQKMTDQSSMNLVTAYAISGIKEYMEMLSNGRGIPYLGIHGVEVTESISKEQGIPRGIYVKEVEADSPAMQAGIQSGDVITEVGKENVTTISGYEKTLSASETGRQLKIKGQRRGSSEYVDVSFNVVVGSKE